MLQHSGTLKHGAADLHVMVVPDSGTGALAGMAGDMTIDTAKGPACVLTYALPPTP